MKNIVKKTLILVICIVAMVLFCTNVYAENGDTQWTDFSNVELEIIKETSANAVSYSLNFKNVTYLQDHNYLVYINNNSTKPTEETTGIIKGAVNKINIDKYLEKSGDIYLWVDENYIDESKTVLDAYKLERPSQNPLGKRITGSFYGENTNGTLIFFNEPSVDSSNRNIKIKIGTITDTNILKQIQNKEASSLNNLLNYAKSASSATISTSCKVGSSNSSIIANANLVKNGYYYVYYEADDENGTYYPVEDVSLYQYQYYDSNGGQLVDYLSDKFKWDIEKGDSAPVTDGKKEDPTTASKILPKTGISIFIIAAVIIISLIGVYSYSKYDKYKGIK